MVDSRGNSIARCYVSKLTQSRPQERLVTEGRVFAGSHQREPGRHKAIQGTLLNLKRRFQSCFGNLSFRPHRPEQSCTAGRSSFITGRASA